MAIDENGVLPSDSFFIDDAQSRCQNMNCPGAALTVPDGDVISIRPDLTHMSPWPGRRYSQYVSWSISLKNSVSA